MSSSEEAPHHIVSKTHSRAEMMTTRLGLSAFEGDSETVQAALKKGIDWTKEGPYLLASAMMGQQWAIARDILRGGMPLSDDVYVQIFYWGERSLLEALPPRPDLLDPLEADARRFRFNKALIDEDLVAARALCEPQWIDAESTILGDRVARAPVHYAARTCRTDLLRLVLDAGADPNALTGDGESAMRIVAQAAGAKPDARRECLRLLEERGGRFIPDVSGRWTRWRVRRGAWLRS